VSLGHLCYGRRFLGESRHHYEDAVSRAAGEGEEMAALRLAADTAFSSMRADLAAKTLLRLADRAERFGHLATATIAVADVATMGDRFRAEFPEALSHERLCEITERAVALAPDGDLEVAAHVAAARAWNGTAAPTATDPDLAEVALDAARRSGDSLLVAGALDAVASAALDSGEWARANRLTLERIDMLDVLPRHDPRTGGEILDILHMVGEARLAIGDLPAAVSAARMAAVDPIGQGLAHLAASHLLLPLALQGHFDEALIEAAKMRHAWEIAGQPAAGWMAPAAFSAYLVCRLRGLLNEAADWQQWARRLTLWPLARGFEPFVQARAALHVGDLDEAVSVIQALPKDRLGSYDPYARAIAAEVAVVAGLAEVDELIAAAAEATRDHLWGAACLARVGARRRGEQADGQAEVLAAVAAWDALDAPFERACTLALLADRADEAAAELATMGCPPPAL
jgi:hypothetical protein